MQNATNALRYFVPLRRFVPLRLNTYLNILFNIVQLKFVVLRFTGGKAGALEKLSEIRGRAIRGSWPAGVPSVRASVRACKRPSHYFMESAPLFCQAFH